MSSTELDNYFHRIGFDGSFSVNLNTLQTLQKLHTQTIPFENFNPLLGIPVKLDSSSLYKKMVTEKRGGYCYEHNNLFRNVLETIGFRVKGLEARVTQNVPKGYLSRRTHMALLVNVNNIDFLADVGFGGMTLTSPLVFEPGRIQETTLEPFRIELHNGIYSLETFIQDRWKELYQFDLQEQFLPDYELANWYSSTHPDSFFLSQLTVSRTGERCRYSLKDNQFSIHDLKNGTQKKILSTANELREILENTFQLSLPVHPRLDEKLKSLVASSN